MFNILIAASTILLQAGSTSTEVTATGADGITLHGTLELPAGVSKNLPAVLLLPGSGPTDRDGNSPLAPIKIDILKQIADRLAGEGIASYRYDKRALPAYRPLWPSDLDQLATFFGYDKFVGDAEGAYKMLQSRPEIDPKRVGVVGHSEGATYALQLGVDLNVRAVVSLGGLGRKMGENLHDQIELRIRAQAPSHTKIYLDYTDAACAAMAAGTPLPPDPPQGLGGLFNPTTVKLLGAFCRLDPTDLVRQYGGPMLALNGAYDQQVSPTKDFLRLAAAMSARRGAISESHLVPRASHCLKIAAKPTDDTFAGPVVPEALDWIAGFLKKNL